MAQNPILDALLKAHEVHDGLSLSHALVTSSEVIAAKAAQGQVSAEHILEALGFIESDTAKRMNQYGRACVAGVVLRAAQNNSSLDNKTRFAAGWVVCRALVDLPMEQSVAQMIVVATKMSLDCALDDVPQQIRAFLLSNQKASQQYLNDNKAVPGTKEKVEPNSAGSLTWIGKLLSKFRKV